MSANVHETLGKVAVAQYAKGYLDGLSAARDAVAAVPGPYGGHPLIERADALAAIDALRGDA